MYEGFLTDVDYLKIDWIGFFNDMCHAPPPLLDKHTTHDEKN